MTIDLAVAFFFYGFFITGFGAGAGGAESSSSNRSSPVSYFLVYSFLLSFYF